jgi:phosphohistidine phosphatase
MKTWIMMRHGKSSWELHVSDADRPLNARGISDVHRIGKFLATKDFQIDAAYTSFANRAAHTALIVTKELGLPFHKLSVSKMLYDFSGEEVLEFVRCLPNEENTVITFGHNHACTALTHQLSGFSGDNIPTAGAVVFRFDVSLWSTIKNGTAECYFPKMLSH